MGCIAGLVSAEEHQLSFCWKTEGWAASLVQLVSCGCQFLWIAIKALYCTWHNRMKEWWKTDSWEQARLHCKAWLVQSVSGNWAELFLCVAVSVSAVLLSLFLSVTPQPAVCKTSGSSPLPHNLFIFAKVYYISSCGHARRRLKVHNDCCHCQER